MERISHGNSLEWLGAWLGVLQMHADVSASLSAQLCLIHICMLNDEAHPSSELIH